MVRGGTFITAGRPLIEPLIVAAEPLVDLAAIVSTRFRGILFLN
jgi:hypothetical protein